MIREERSKAGRAGMKKTEKAHDSYAFFCEGRIVRIGFSGNGKSLDDVLKNYFLTLTAGAGDERHP